MESKIDNFGKQVLAEIVKLIQKRGMEGSKGTWKEFLKSTDKKFGDTLSDPSKRSADILANFLKTFTKEEDLKFIDKVLQWHFNREVLDNYKKTSPDSASPEQKLVLLTLQHPNYSLDYLFPSHEEEWVVTKLHKKSKSMRSNDMVAVDCEMVLCEDGTEALVKVCVVDRDLKVKLNELVKPNKAVVDYRTAITGISAKDLNEVTCSLTDVQKSMKKILSHGTILVGHGLNNDLTALKLDHARVIDTSFIFKYLDEPSFRRPSLNNLCKSVLGHEIRGTDAPHNCLDDACAAMKLVLARLERGVDNDILVAREKVPETGKAKMLLHRIPIHVPTEELASVFPGDYTIERQAIKKAGAKFYYALAVFKSMEEGHLAYDNIEGDEDKDSFGQLQKLISIKLSTGETTTLIIRKMAHRDALDKNSSKKRPFHAEESADESRKMHKTEKVVADSNQCHDHVQEINELKEVLSHRDTEIKVLYKIISDLTRKQGL